MHHVLHDILLVLFGGEVRELLGESPLLHPGDAALSFPGLGT
jgi:hypothetical protein